jgi:uncharacterized membrane protein
VECPVVAVYAQTPIAADSTVTDMTASAAGKRLRLFAGSATSSFSLRLAMASRISPAEQNGRMTDLKPAGEAACSNAFAINAGGQAVGNATDCQGVALAAMLWDHGHAYDLNTTVAPSALHVTEAEYINSRGEIVAFAALPNGNQHVALLVPSGLAASEGLISNAPAPSAVGSATTRFSSPARHELLPLPLDRRLGENHLWAR